MGAADRRLVGPQYWQEMAPAAAGRRQSPIVIRACEATFCQTLRERPLVVSYDALSANKLVNNGHTVQVNVNGPYSSVCPIIHSCSTHHHFLFAQ